ncbi:tetratricopeptide repeat protein [Synechococcus sp. PCC 7502]|uniref:photosystem I assembly protein Ycf3 n=1 Tax=Synechococcus sp. PCC 7502 TaxID=1173263 RepID=UPI00029FCF28|nr:photosystem I assembly protein Ycf3 [Synechococcus sp. PCC 7502]AFY72984.1 tetratricopeptide repeat protein [Synechococcus sp. PCC 7502]
MARSQRNDNFVDQTFTVIADTILKFFPASQKEKEAFAYYRDGMSAQGDGEYAEALENYEEALKLEENPYDRSYILYNIGLIHASNGDHDKALEYYHQAIDINPRLPQALNNIAVIYHYKGEKSETEDDREDFFTKASEYWVRAIRIAPNNYIEAQNWLKTTGRADINAFF